jgi:hypothetical protein
MKTSLYEQIRQNFISLISLLVALSALLYTTWREEMTERNRNLRAASFEVLKNLGELQIAVNYMHYEPNNSMANPLIAWGHVALIGDLSQILPTPVPAASKHLIEVWKNGVADIQGNEKNAENISAAIDQARQAVLQVIYKLN